MTFKIDIDGVLRDMLAVMVRLYNERFGTNLTKDDITDYDLTHSFPLYAENGMNVYQYLCEDHKQELYLDADVLPGAKDAMEAIAADPANKIIIVTHQPSFEAKMLTLQWLERHKIPYNDICFVSRADKKDVKANVLIDDCPYVLDAETDALTVCIDYGYNRDGNYHFRFKSIKEIIPYLHGKKIARA